MKQREPGRKLKLGIAFDHDVGPLKSLGPRPALFPEQLLEPGFLDLLQPLACLLRGLSIGS
jgi:hypothetical protein